MQVTVNYRQNGELGAEPIVDSNYETARDKAFELVPEGAEKLSIMVDREA